MTQAQVKQRLEKAFLAIEQGSMAELPVCNAALTTELVGLRRFQAGWLGCLITPWTLQLLLLPDDTGGLKIGRKRSIRLSQGEIVFAANENEGAGPYLACPLASPLHEFKDQQSIRRTAEEVMELLFQEPKPEQSNSVEVGMPVGSTGRLDIDAEVRQASTGTRRDFLRGFLKD